MLAALSRLTRPARLPAGQWLFLEGQDANRLYFVRSGNLPVDLMVESGEGPVLAVDVMRRLGAAAAGDSAPALPSIVETLSRATVLGSAERAEGNRSLAGLTITPDVEGVALRDFSRLDDAIDAGRRAAEQALASGGKEALVASLNEP